VLKKFGVDQTGGEKFTWPIDRAAEKVRPCSESTAQVAMAAGMKMTGHFGLVVIESDTNVVQNDVVVMLDVSKEKIVRSFGFCWEKFQWVDIDVFSRLG
jgi:hypothetical protein